MVFRVSKEKKALTDELETLKGREERLSSAMIERGAEGTGDERVRSEARAVYEQMSRCLDLLTHYPGSKGGRAARERIEEIKATLAARSFELGADIGVIELPDELE